MKTAAKRRKLHARVTEEYSSPKPRIDKDRGIIYDVLILGRKAKNGRRYTMSAMEEAVRGRKYEHLQVYIGPHVRNKWAKRSPHDHAGELVNTRMASDGIRGDLLYNRASRGGRLVLEIAERFSEHFGLSHHAEIEGYEVDGEKVITRILEIAVADVVKDPGTTDTVFEEVDGEPIRASNQEEEYDGEEGEGKSCAEIIKELIGEIHSDDEIDDDTKMKATKMAMKLKKLLTGEDDGEEDDGEEEAEGEEDEDDGEEEVDPKKLKKRKPDDEDDEDAMPKGRKGFVKLVKSIVTKAVRSSGPKRRPPMSSARSDATESVDTAKAKKRAEADKNKPKSQPQSLKDVRAAYEGDDEDEDEE